MADLPFIKMHGAGNDYVFVDGFENDLNSECSEIAVAISDRHVAVGSDGLVWMLPPESPDCDVQMRMWNTDGSEGAMCGNALRCIALWMRLTERVADLCRVRTLSRLVTVSVLDFCSITESGWLQVDMGRPDFCQSSGAAGIRMLNGLQWPTTSRGRSRSTGDGRSDGSVNYQFVSMGNPHAVVMCEELSPNLLNNLGPVISTHPEFPEGTNVEFVVCDKRNALRVDVWERGSGATLACGSGACAAAVAAVEQGLCDRDTQISVVMPGGVLSVIRTSDERVLLSGPAAVSFRGIWRHRSASKP